MKSRLPLAHQLLAFLDRVAIASEVFTPTDGAVAKARSILIAFERAAERARRVIETRQQAFKEGAAI